MQEEAQRPDRPSTPGSHLEPISEPRSPPLQIKVEPQEEEEFQEEFQQQFQQQRFQEESAHLHRLQEQSAQIANTVKVLLATYW